ncbi:hypothetical protein [Gordonia sp. N1V]|uniref:hypothetical protein n=1 Tax=Gordonia sp. N1V TaxID=3034163 RepID=UPI0023E281DD|nr:hypothetical protein [Gordonia sp. N1V]MDF3284996.1 hypothetical protein [Gordonia sp. N1V]
MITWTVTTYTPGHPAPATTYDTTDTRTTALTDAANAALTALDTAVSSSSATPYLSITVDGEILVMLAVGIDDHGHPDLADAIATIHAALTPPPLHLT